MVDPNQAYQPAPPVEPNVSTSPPPAPLAEVQPPAPFDGAVWIPGYWWWGPSGYVWVVGAPAGLGLGRPPVDPP